MRSEYVVLHGAGGKLVVHADNCRCSKRMRDSFFAYGMNRDEIIYDIDPFSELRLKISFAKCAEEKIKNVS